MARALHKSTCEPVQQLVVPSGYTKIDPKMLEMLRNDMYRRMQSPEDNEALTTLLTVYVDWFNGLLVELIRNHQQQFDQLVADHAKALKSHV